MFLFLIRYVDSSLVVDSIKIDSDILDEMEKQLNKSIPGVGNWRSLAMRLEISNDNCDEFDPAGSGQLSQRSPTKMMLKWLAGARKDITICDVIHGLEEIKRYDAIKILTSHYNNVIGELLLVLWSFNLSDFHLPKSYILLVVSGIPSPLLQNCN